MTDMVFAPTFDDVDSEREVVLEEIAMVDDNPQDLVHDLAAEAVFGEHPLGRPVIGSADVIAQVSPRALRDWHRRAYAGPRIVLAAAGNVSHERLVELFTSRRPSRNGTQPAPRRSPVRRRRAPATGSSGARPSSTTSCLAAPGISRDDETPLRRRAPRRDPRRLGVVAALPGDPREAGDGLLRLYVRLAIRRDGPGGHLRRNARGQPRRVRRGDRRGAGRRRGRHGCDPASSTGPRRTSRAGSSSRSSAPRTG